MQLPASTGEVARFLGVTEPRLNDLIRRARIAPLPPVAAGRRVWSPDHIVAAAVACGIPVEPVQARLAGAEEARV